ncbi:unnamed protein product [Prunus armeniaca]
MSSAKILLTSRWYVAPAFFWPNGMTSVGNECRMLMIRRMHENLVVAGVGVHEAEELMASCGVH